MLVGWSGGGRGEIGCGEGWVEDGEGCRDGWSLGVEYVWGWERVSCAGWESVNWIAAGRLVRHCSSWWCSSALTAGRGMVPESAVVLLDGVVRILVVRETYSKSRASDGYGLE